MNNYTNSPLVSVTRLSPNHSGQRTHAIDRITPHCVVGYCTAEGLGDWFARESTQASSNYGIDKDGRVGLYVEEKNRSWCTSSSANDQRAITIECASDTKEPYSFRDATYQRLVELCVDICRRNGKNRLIWIEDKNTALNYTPGAGEMLLTVHRWFANKSCPGNWMFARMGDLAAKVTAALGSSPQPQPAPDPELPAVPFLVRVIIDDLNYRSGPGMDYQVNGQTGKGTFTIVETSNGWGRLKSGAGWIWLKNPEYCTIAGSTTPAPQPQPTTTDRNAVVAQAKAWIGKNEADGSHKEIIDVYNSHKPLARGYAMKYTDAWCAAFVSAVAIKCGVTDILPTECGCEKMVALFKKLDEWVEDDAYTPAPGDVIFYDWQDSGSGDNTGSSDHVGIVEKVSGSTITVIEGNTSNAVGRRTLQVNGKYIRGYGVPKYSTAAADPATAKKSVEELAKEVWEGKWGNGSERKERLTAAGYDYAAVQAAVNAMAKGQTSAQAFTTYTVKAGDSLWAIAARFLGDGRRYPEIRELNGIKSDNVIYTGQILKIPK